MEPSSNQNPALSRVPVLDRDKNITFLLKELDSLRAFNSKVWDHYKLNIFYIYIYISHVSEPILSSMFISDPRRMQLQEQLVQKEKELQRKEFEEQLQQEQMEQKIWRQPTGKNTHL